MKDEDAVIHPIIANKPPKLGHRCIMAATQPDLDQLHRVFECGAGKIRRMFMSRLYYGCPSNPSIALIGPFIGAPYAALLLESLIAWDIREVLFFGWCGSISQNIKIGDVIVPDRSFIDDGTSMNYMTAPCAASFPCASVQAALKSKLAGNKIRFHEGPIWSTDAIFRETTQKVTYYQKKGVLGVEMEAAALFSVGGFRNIDVGCILLVSDELSSLQWNPGFKNPLFMERRRQACGILRHFW